MIEERKATRYTPSCESCGWRGSSVYRRSIAERELAVHPCGQHREAHDSTGGYRGILGGFRRGCVCGERYVSDSLDAFKCPKEEQA